MDFINETLFPRVQLDTDPEIRFSDVFRTVTRLSQHSSYVP